MSENPYAAPKAALTDTESKREDGTFLPEGQRVGIDRGWSWIADSWSPFTKQWGLWIVGSLGIVVLTVLLSAIPVVGQIVSIFVYVFFWAGIMLAADAQYKEGRFRFAHFFAGFKTNVGTIAALGILLAIADMAILVLIAVMAGFEPLLLVKGGTPEDFSGFSMMRIALAYLVGMSLWLPFTMAFWFSPGLVALHDYSVGRALRVSFVACLKNFLPYLLYGILMVVFMFLAIIPLGLGIFVLVPIACISIYVSYRDIFFAV
jgi:hypothetical protein